MHQVVCSYEKSSCAVLPEQCPTGDRPVTEMRRESASHDLLRGTSHDVVRIIVGRDRAQCGTAENQPMVYRFVDRVKTDVGHESIAARGSHRFPRFGVEPERHFVAALFQREPFEDSQRRLIGTVGELFERAFIP